PQVEIEISKPMELQAGDGVLLCSDGLSGYVADVEIEKQLEHFSSAPEEAVSALIQAALQTGGEDNITVQYIYLGRGAAVRAAANRTEPLPPNTAVPDSRRKIGLLVLTVVVAALVIGFVWRARRHMGNNVARPVQTINKSAGGARNSK